MSYLFIGPRQRVQSGQFLAPGLFAKFAGWSQQVEINEILVNVDTSWPNMGNSVTGLLTQQKLVRSPLQVRFSLR